jgi:hypothetical protein
MHSASAVPSDFVEEQYWPLAHRDKITSFTVPFLLSQSSLEIRVGPTFRLPGSLAVAMDDPTQEEITAWQDKADAILEEAASLPCLTAASATAVLDLVLKDDMLDSSSVFQDHFTAILSAVRDYIAEQVQS